MSKRACEAVEEEGAPVLKRAKVDVCVRCGQSEGRVLMACRKCGKGKLCVECMPRAKGAPGFDFRQVPQCGRCRGRLWGRVNMEWMQSQTGGSNLDMWQMKQKASVLARREEQLTGIGDMAAALKKERWPHQLVCRWGESVGVKVVACIDFGDVLYKMQYTHTLLERAMLVMHVAWLYEDARLKYEQLDDTVQREMRYVKAACKHTDFGDLINTDATPLANRAKLAIKIAELTCAGFIVLKRGTLDAIYSIREKYRKNNRLDTAIENLKNHSVRYVRK